MSLTLTHEDMQDDLAILLAMAMAAANRRAKEMGINVADSIISIAQIADDSAAWRVNYGPKDYVGRRGGDLIVDVDAKNSSITRVLRGQ